MNLVPCHNCVITHQCAYHPVVIVLLHLRHLLPSCYDTINSFRHLLPYYNCAIAHQGTYFPAACKPQGAYYPIVTALFTHLGTHYPICNCAITSKEPINLL